jgi:hypothetical protein
VYRLITLTVQVSRYQVPGTPFPAVPTETDSWRMISYRQPELRKSTRVAQHYILCLVGKSGYFFCPICQVSLQNERFRCPSPIPGPHLLRVSSAAFQVVARIPRSSTSQPAAGRCSHPESSILSMGSLIPFDLISLLTRDLVRI